MHLYTLHCLTGAAQGSSWNTQTLGQSTQNTLHTSTFSAADTPPLHSGPGDTRHQGQRRSWHQALARCQSRADMLLISPPLLLMYNAAPTMHHQLDPLGDSNQAAWQKRLHPSHISITGCGCSTASCLHLVQPIAQLSLHSPPSAITVHSPSTRIPIHLHHAFSHPPNRPPQVRPLCRQSVQADNAQASHQPPATSPSILLPPTSWRQPRATEARCSLHPCRWQRHMHT
jgi:hypothetical protein